MKHRVKSIDYLRGIFAVLVMLFHYCMYTKQTVDSATFLGKMGVYAVSGFFVISGMSMRIAYADITLSFRNIIFFLQKRFFRLAPLYWFMLFLVIITPFMLSFISATPPPNMPSLLRLLYNITLLFGIFKPTSYMLSGGWSIGVEVVFYMFFPMLLFLHRRNPSIMPIISLLLFIFFAFYLIDSTASLQKIWHLYINPCNQLLFFVVGFMFVEINQSVSKKGIYIAGSIAVLIFIFYNIHDSLVAIMTGLPRVIFSFAIICVCLASYHITIPKGIVSKVLQFLGTISYSLYLSHPLIMNAVAYLINDRLTTLLIVAMPATLFLSFLLYKYIELPCIYYARRISS